MLDNYQKLYFNFLLMFSSYFHTYFCRYITTTIPERMKGIMLKYSMGKTRLTEIFIHMHIVYLNVVCVWQLLQNRSHHNPHMDLSR